MVVSVAWDLVTWCLQHWPLAYFGGNSAHFDVCMWSARKPYSVVFLGYTFYCHDFSHLDPHEHLNLALPRKYVDLIWKIWRTYIQIDDRLPRKVMSLSTNASMAWRKVISFPISILFIGKNLKSLLVQQMNSKCYSSAPNLQIQPILQFLIVSHTSPYYTLW